MGYSKKTKPFPVRLTEKLHRLIEEEADKGMRNKQDEILILIAEALHKRRSDEKFNIKDYL